MYFERVPCNARRCVTSRYRGEYARLRGSLCSSSQGTVLPSVSTFNIDLLFFPQVKSILQVGFFTNRMFLYAVGASLMGQMLVIYFPPLQAVFQTEPLDWTDILLLTCVASSVLFVDEVRKLVIRIRSKRNQHQKDNFLV